MYILDKYILKNIVLSYIFILLLFVGLYCIIDISSNLSDILKSKPPIAALITYYINMIPLIFLTVSPFALPISLFYTFGELNRHNEVLSMRASGISIFRMSLPIIFFAMLISFFSLFIQEKILIDSQKRIEDIKINLLKKNFSVAPEDTNLAFSSGDMIFFIGKFSPQKKTLQDVIIFEENDNKSIIKKTLCKSAIYEKNKWEGKDIIEYMLDDKGNISGPPTFWKEKALKLDETPEALVFKKSILFQFSSLKNLKKEMRQLKKIKAYDKLSNLIIDYNRKIAEPLTPLFLIIGILPFALEIKKRRAAFSSLGIGIIFGFIYYTFMYLSIALGKGGLILPIFSAWLAPIFFLTYGTTGLVLTK